MKIKVLANLGRGLPDYKEQQIVEVDDEAGQALIDQGLAIIHGVPKKPKITAPAPEPVDLNEENSDTVKRYKAKGKESKK